MTDETVRPTNVAEALATRDRTGRRTQTRCHVTCPCGNVQTVYRWSWAGHGFFRCSSCRRKVGYAG